MHVSVSQLYSHRTRLESSDREEDECGHEVSLPDGLVVDGHEHPVKPAWRLPDLLQAIDWRVARRDNARHDGKLI